MKVTPTAIPEVLVVEPKVFADDRGFFSRALTRERGKSRLVLLHSLFRIIIHDQPKVSCAAFIIR